MLTPRDRDGNPTTLYRLQSQMWRMHKMGVSYQDWRLMPKWIRDDYELRHQADVKKVSLELAGTAELNIGKVLGLLVRKVLGV